MKRYDSAPSKGEMKKNLGYEAKVPASLEGGYKLISSHILGHIDGLIPDKQYDKRGADGIYSKDNNKEGYISLEIAKAGAEYDSPIFKNAKAIAIGNTDAYWIECKIHTVPKYIMDKKIKNKRTKLMKLVTMKKKF